jgi:hypothetical protein
VVITDIANETALVEIEIAHLEPGAVVVDYINRYWCVIELPLDEAFEAVGACDVRLCRHCQAMPLDCACDIEAEFESLQFDDEEYHAHRYAHSPEVAA